MTAVHAPEQLEASRSEPMPTRVRAGFVMELGLGHTTFYQALRDAVSATDDIEPVWMPVSFEGSWPLGWVPKLRHDTVVRAGLTARSELHSVLQRQHLDVIFFHTQMPAVFCSGIMRRIPAVISIDATPAQFASVGEYYGLRSTAWSRLTGPGIRRSYKAAFQAAAHVIAFSHWAANAAAAEYGLERARVGTVFPGVNLSRWHPAGKTTEGPIRLLFVGGEFERKGGDLLLRWMSDGGAQHCVLDVVTGSDVKAQPGVRVHRGYVPNDPRLVQLFQAADLFVLPTRADISPWVVMEAMAAGTPALVTGVGAVGEYAGDDGSCARIIEPDSYQQLRDQLSSLVGDRSKLVEMGNQARRRAEREFDATQNLKREMDILRGAALGRRKPADGF